MPNRFGSTNERLGFSKDARLLIINADDFGMCHAVNEATIRTIRQGVATSCTLMVPCPWAGHAMHLLRQNPDIPFGVHLTAVSEHATYRWGPVAPQESVPSLQDDGGCYHEERRTPLLLQEEDLEDQGGGRPPLNQPPVDAGSSPPQVDHHRIIPPPRGDSLELPVPVARENAPP